MLENDGGPAFPQANETSGMSLRDYFAAKAMVALQSDYARIKDLAECMTNSFESGESDEVAERNGRALCLVVAKVAYMQADAMLEARNAPPT